MIEYRMLRSRSHSQRSSGPTVPESPTRSTLCSSCLVIAPQRCAKGSYPNSSTTRRTTLISKSAPLKYISGRLSIWCVIFPCFTCPLKILIPVQPGADDYEVVPNSQLVVARHAYKGNSSKYAINNKTSNFTEVTTLLKDRGIDLDHKRFLILQVCLFYSYDWSTSSL